MILSGLSIEAAVKDGYILIEPYDREQLNPASYDLTLGSSVLEYRYGSSELDSKQDNAVIRMEMNENGFVLQPGRGYLMHTRERVATRTYVPVVDGKSSIGRLFVWVHVTAGYGDPGFDGQYTLEVTSVYPTRVYPGMRIAQIRFHAIEGEVKLYDGNYKNETSTGPCASRSWKQFR